MSGRKITEILSDFSHMRSQIIYDGNNKNTIYKFRGCQAWLFMLFYRSNTNIREIIVNYVLK